MIDMGARTEVMVAWTPEARERLTRIPAFLRERICRRLEERAVAQRLTEITAAFMAAHRPGFLTESIHHCGANMAREPGRRPLN